jgi:hypothetical protein
MDSNSINPSFVWFLILSVYKLVAFVQCTLSTNSTINTCRFLNESYYCV